jgi:hypothetical protein
MIRSISKSGPPELGEPAFPLQRLIEWNDEFVCRMRDAISAGAESVVEGTVRTPGTRNPRPYLADRGALP